MLCNNCKKEIRDGSKFCKFCGQNLEKETEPSFCTSCGKQTKNNSLFCKHCGTFVGNVVNVTEKDNKYNKKKFAMIVISVALVAVVCFLLFPRGEERASNKQTNTHTRTDSTGGDEIISKPQGLSGDDDSFVSGGDEERESNKQTNTHTRTGNTGGDGVISRPQGLSGNDDCFVCGGDGKKDCTSCDGGFIIEYITGTYTGYGPSTREVRKKCMVCRGSGEVKCYH